MKRNIVVFTMFYPPLNSIASQRFSGWNNALNSDDFNIYFITRYYDKEQIENKSKMEFDFKAKDFTIDFDVENNVYKTNYDEQNKLLSNFSSIPRFIRGGYGYFHYDVYHFGWINYAIKAFEDLISKIKVDVVILSYGPPVLLKMAKILSVKFKVKVVLDFRDLYITEQDNKIHSLVKVINLLRIKKHLSGILFVSEGMEAYFEKKTKWFFKSIPQTTIHSGVNIKNYSETVASEVNNIEIFENIKKSFTKLLVHTGSIYKGQDVDFFIKGVFEFNNKYSENIGILFVGDKVDGVNSSFVKFMPKVDHQTSIYIQKNSDGLLLPVWKGRYTGWSGKTYEYLLSKKPVFVSPNPQDDLLLYFKKVSNVILIESESIFFKKLKLLLNDELVSFQEIDNYNFLSQTYWGTKLGEFLSEKSL